ncbi:nicotinate-nucleotide--dimethylbenzimidazole phosphoribosyltransferase [Streptomyces mashuensis]|uniref:nicotinate-nucleotide--dimethylbenzimidazole phosphoribosyltransferase n=1 Tax=Streptomyces mashuensis TaxID=33904 RepID=UPI003570F017
MPGAQGSGDGTSPVLGAGDGVAVVDGSGAPAAQGAGDEAGIATAVVPDANDGAPVAGEGLPAAADGAVAPAAEAGAATAGEGAAESLTAAAVTPGAADGTAVPDNPAAADSATAAGAGDVSAAMSPGVADGAVAPVVDNAAPAAAVPGAVDGAAPAADGVAAPGADEGTAVAASAADAGAATVAASAADGADVPAVGHSAAADGAVAPGSAPAVPGTGDGATAPAAPTAADDPAVPGAAAVPTAPGSDGAAADVPAEAAPGSDSTSAVAPGADPAPDPHPLPSDAPAGQDTAPAPASPEAGPQTQPPAAEGAAGAPAPSDTDTAVAADTAALPQQNQPAAEATVPAPQGAPAAEATTPTPQGTPAAEATAAEATAPAEDQPAQPEEPAGPPADPYGDAERAAVHRVMRERRDIRKGFRTDPIPHEVLLRVLEAAHTAPSVGHSQPWDFVVIRSEETRRTMHELVERQREAYAKSLPKGRAKQFKELKIEAILDTPVNIVVTADPTRGGRHTLGRHTQPQMAPYSSALAVENLWLAARAEGLGVGWVSFFDERELVRALGLPEHLEVVAYLCVGYVDEFPDEPELLQAGWSKRRPLSWVVHEETYGRRALPGEDPHDLLAETLRGIRPLDAKALGEAWERQKRMTKPSGALGMLEIISAQLCGLSRKCPPPIPEPAAVAIFAGDHGVHHQGVTAWPQEVTAQMVANFLGGGAVCNAFANQVGAEVCVVDVGVAGELPSTPGLLPRKVRPGTDDFTTGPAMSREEALRAVEIGIETARDLVTAGNKALLTGEMGIANTTVSAALISVYTGADPAEVTGRGTGINDEMHARKVDVVRRALELHQPDPKDPIGVLAAVGGLEHAALVGLILGGASLRTPVILDGVSAGAAALVARAVAPEALAACIAGHRSAEPGHVAALTKLGLRPLVDLDLRLGEGTGALLALPVVQSAARAMHEVATFDTAGVSEKK